MAVLSTDEVLCAEAAAIHGAPLKLGESFIYRTLNNLNSAAICLSGGGIRSAAFALGVIQALAIHPRSLRSGSMREPVERAEDSLLAKFHYLSTVSGGGYTGSWLSAWRLHQPFSQIWKQLIGRPEGPDFEPRELSWLRSFSNYLTPRRGIASGDTWAAIVLGLRNLLLNWLVIIPPLCVLVLGLKFLALTSTWVILWCTQPGWYPRWESDDWLVYTKIIIECAFGIASLFCLTRALAFATRNRPNRRSPEERGPDRLQLLRGYVLWSLLSAFLLIHFLASDLLGNLLLRCSPNTWTLWVLSFCTEHELARELVRVPPVPQAAPWNIARYPVGVYLIASAAIGAVVYCVSWCLALSERREPFDLLMWTISGTAYGAIVGLGLYFYLIIPDEGVANLQVYFLHFVFGVPWILGAQLVADTLFAGLSSYEAGSDADREWFGRVASWILCAAAVWLMLTYAVLFGTLLRRWLKIETISEVENLATAIVTLSGVITAVFGKSALTLETGAAKGTWSNIINVIFPVSASVFVGALLITISYALDNFLFDGLLMPETTTITETFAWKDKFEPLLVALAVFIAIGAAASWAVNINRFSLHALYRNRLVRAFLAASRARNADRFTGFDPKDNPKVHGLRSRVESGDWRPFQLINISLNLVASQRLAWQERKAGPFTVSALHCGSSVIGYRDSARYGGPDGISLGTAMAISGAAASPNMGYHSSPAITFLMTMFNVRLGWWLGNPGRCGEESYTNEGPAFAIHPLVQEALGLTTDDRKYVYLSDGGHFENLGLYEVVRRRCRYIVVCDAGWDPSFRLDDLANAVRKIEIDLGVQMRFTNLEKLKHRPVDGTDLGPGHPYYAIGEVDYRTADGAEQNGTILYIKAGYHGVESAGIRGYANANPEFPHESTVDQWFTESQFESYRALGFEITDGIFNDVFAHAGWDANPSLENIFATLRRLQGRSAEENASPGVNEVT